MQIRNNGFVRLCCKTPWLRDEAGNALSVYEHSAAEIWNSKAMQEIRRAMIEGKQVAECAKCWRQESRGEVSRRMTENARFQAQARFQARAGLKAKLLRHLNFSHDPLEEIREEALCNNFFIQASHIDLELEVGNLCNLKCRMCNPAFSSKIENDPVQSKWYNNPDLEPRQDESNNNPYNRFPEKITGLKKKHLSTRNCLEIRKQFGNSLLKAANHLPQRKLLTSSTI